MTGSPKGTSTPFATRPCWAHTTHWSGHPSVSVHASVPAHDRSPLSSHHVRLNMFTAARKKHEEYKRRCFEESGYYSPYDAEIGKKIGQLQWLIAKAQILNAKVVKSMSSDCEVDFDTACELELMTEAFYYFVGRLVELFKHNSRFGNIPPSNAEKVRHQLLQHPEKQKDRQKASLSFECGSLDGPKIKSYKGPHGALHDNGLFQNAREFNRKLVHIFENEDQKA